MRESSDNDKNKITPLFKNSPSQSTQEENACGANGDIKAELTNLFKEHLPKKAKFNQEDQKSIDSEKAFVARFGFSLGKKKREALFELIERHDLSDKEVKAIHSIGSFEFDGKNPKLGVSKWIFIQGFVQLGIVLKFALLFAFLFIFIEKTTFYQHALSLTMLLLVTGFSAFVSNLYVKPYRIIQQRIQLSCKEMPFMQRLRQRTVCYLD